MRVSLIAMSAFLMACSNPYRQFYRGDSDARQTLGYDTSITKLEIHRTSDPESEIALLEQRGFREIGSSAFNTGEAESERDLRRQARRIGAHAVLVSTRFTHSETGAVPLSMPAVARTRSKGVTTVYGSHGTVSAYSNGTSTSYGSDTVVVPYSVRRYDERAFYFAKFRPRVGVTVDALDDETRQRLQSNHGVRVRSIVDDSPAFVADIIADDLILMLAGTRVQSPDHFIQLIDQFEGERVILDIDRGGRSLQKTLTINRLARPDGSLPIPRRTK